MRERLDFRRRFLGPVLTVFVVMALSWLAYNLAWRLEQRTLHHVLAAVSGTLLFVSVAFGALFVYPVAACRGASLAERVIACWVNPFIWATKECVRLSVSFGFLECLYYYLNPLNVWLGFGITAEIALSEWIWRRWRGRRGEELGDLHPWAGFVLFASLSLAVLLFLWGQGENSYALFLRGYRALFGAGLGVGAGL